jgi:hypothetical protein
MDIMQLTTQFQNSLKGTRQGKKTPHAPFTLRRLDMAATHSFQIASLGHVAFLTYYANQQISKSWVDTKSKNSYNCTKISITTIDKAPRLSVR